MKKNTVAEVLLIEFIKTRVLQMIIRLTNIRIHYLRFRSVNKLVLENGLVVEKMQTTVKRGSKYFKMPKIILHHAENM